MTHRFEREPAYVTDRNAAVNHLGLNYVFAVCIAAVFLTVSSLADVGADFDRLNVPILEAAARPSANLYGSLACDGSFRQPSS